MHLELQQPTNCNLTVLISSAEITFGKIVIQALMASSVRPPRNEQVVLPTSQYHQPSLAKLAQPSQKGQVLNLGRSHEFGRNIKRASTNVGGVQARPLCIAVGHAHQILIRGMLTTLWQSGRTPLARLLARRMAGMALLLCSMQQIFNSLEIFRRTTQNTVQCAICT